MDVIFGGEGSEYGGGFVDVVACGDVFVAVCEGATSVCA